MSSPALLHDTCKVETTTWTSRILSLICCWVAHGYYEVLDTYPSIHRYPVTLICYRHQCRSPIEREEEEGSTVDDNLYSWNILCVCVCVVHVHIICLFNMFLLSKFYRFALSFENRRQPENDIIRLEFVWPRLDLWVFHIFDYRLWIFL